AQGGEGGQGTMLNHRVDRRVSVSQEDQFQRNGVILDQRSGVGVTTPVLSVGGERGRFTGIFEIIVADKARVGRVKRRPFCAVEHRLPPYHPFATLAARSTLASLPDPGGELGQGNVTSTIRPAN